MRSFFFQAEDGIRDGRVTGVQTCALPIYPGDQHGDGLAEHGRLGLDAAHAPAQHAQAVLHGGVRVGAHARSEERRVGKEWRSRWSPYHKKKKELSTYRLTRKHDLWASVGH